MTEPVNDKAESIRHRLRNLLRERGEDMQFGLQRYAIERFLYRLGISAHRERFVLKGAALFALWGGSVYRPTRDLDFTGYGSTDEKDVLAALREICLLQSLEDELVFDPDTLSAERIRDDSEYNGLRIRLEATLGTSSMPIQIDIGFGNAIEPPPQYAEYPTLLDDPTPRIRTYPLEAVIAEKLHAMVILGERNSRYKDFYDLQTFAQQFRFAGERLARAIAATFERRSTPIEVALPIALTPRFFADEARAQQWRAYVTRNSLPAAPADFDSVGELIRQFLGPVWTALAENVAFASSWRPGGSWNHEETEKNILMARPAPAGTRSREQKHSDNANTVGVENIEIPTATPLRRFKAYPVYKDSGVEWLGEIPEHWNIRKLKRVCSFAYGGSLSAENRTDGEIPVYGSNGPVGTHEYANTLGPCLVIGRKGSYGKVNYSPHPVFAIDTTFFVDSRCSSVDLRWLFYVLTWAALDSATRDSAIPGLDREDAYARDLPLCSGEEQRAIAAFLDGETAKIDALVANKERLIELLREKRAALITRAVTKGLNPNVPMTGSGVEWLGKIPKDWEVERIKWVARMESGHTPDKKVESYWQDGNIAWVSLADTGQLREVDFIVDTAVRTTSDGIAHSSAHILPAGTVVFSRDATIGLCAITHSDMAVSQHFIGWVCGQRLTAEYLLFVLRSMTQELERLTMGATVRTIGMPDVRSLVTPVPPLQVQEQIVEYVHEHRAQIDVLVGKIRDGIDRLKELRTALISAAVTGKIDVREEAA